MEMTAEVIYDVKALRKFNLSRHISIGTPLGTVIVMCILSFLLIALAVTAFALHVGSTLQNICSLFIAGLTLLCYVFLPLAIIPAVTVKQRKKKEYGPVCFQFGDTGFSVHVDGKGINEHTELEYTAIPRLVETKEYMFLYVNRNAAYILKKDCLKGGTAEELRFRITGCPNVRYQRKKI